MKICFLDFDGVLNSGKFLAAQDKKKFPSQREFRDAQIDPDKVELLNQIISASGTKIVISSTWRKLEPLDELKKLLVSKGLIGEIIGITPESCSGIRGEEIQEWLDDHPDVESFVILDDNQDMAHLLPRLIKTAFSDGLLKKHVNRAIEML